MAEEARNQFLLIRTIYMWLQSSYFQILTSGTLLHHLNGGRRTPLPHLLPQGYDGSMHPHTITKPGGHAIVPLVSGAVLSLVAFIIVLLWKERPLAGTPVVLREDGSAITDVPMVNLDLLKQMHPIRLAFADDDDLARLGPWNDARAKIDVSISQDDGKTFVLEAAPRSHTYETKNPILLGYLQFPRRTTAIVRVQLQPGVNWPKGMMVQVEADVQGKLQREDSRMFKARLIILGVLLALLAVLSGAAWIINARKQREAKHVVKER